LYFLSLSANRDIAVTFKTDAAFSKPVQYELPVFLSYSRIQTITSVLFTTALGSNELVQLMVGNEGDQTWIAQIKESSVHAEKILTFGVNARLVSEGNGLLILLENSYTHGGMLMNNNG
jgi:hypothetical protein